MADQLSGVVTFLITDIEGSTRLIQRVGEDLYAEVLADHRRIIGAAVAAHGGIDVRTEGDGCVFAFAMATEAVAAAAEAQVALVSHPWPADREVRVRMGLHTGEAVVDGEDFSGLAARQSQQIAPAGNGGQIVMSAVTRTMLQWPDHDERLVALGSHRLRDLGEPVELYQLAGEGLPREFPPLRSLERAAHNLPVQASSFLGRDADLAEGASLLASQRLVTVVGPGGIGKTRLAFQLAARCVDDFADGVWVVHLAPLTAGDLVARSLGNALGLPDEAAAGPLEGLTRHLEDRKSLIVLDNCEHLVAAAAEVADTLLRRCPEVRVLATSRQPLRIDGEYLWSLAPLGLPGDDDESFESAAASDGVRLFAERAAHADGRFSLDPQNVGSVVTICRRLDGIPLAIELAAARAPSMSASQIAERLDRSLDLLSKGRRTASDRQKTLRATIGWSEALLDEVGRRLLARLSVFRGGFDEADVAAVCGEPGQGDEEILNALVDLVDKSLVVARPLGARPQYAMLQTIADYAAERLDAAGETATVRNRHLAWFRAEADRQMTEISDARSADLGDVLDRAEARHDNVRVALAWALEGDDPDEGLDLASAAARFWERKAYFREGRQWLEAGLAKGGSPAARCPALLASAAMSNRMSDNAAAQPRLEEAHRLAEELGLDGIAVHTASELGTVALEEGRPEEAEDWYRRGAEVARRVGATEDLAGAIVNRGLVQLELGHLEQGEVLVLEALAEARKIDSPRLLATCLVAAATIVLYRGDATAARGPLEECLELTRQTGDEFMLVFVSCNLAEVERREGNDHEAARLLAGAVAWCQASGALRAMIFVLIGVSALMTRRDEVDEALMLMGTSQGISDAMGIFLDPFQVQTLADEVAELTAKVGADRAAALLDLGRATDPMDALGRAERWLAAQL